MMRVLMVCHTEFDINSGGCGCTVNLGRSLETLGINVDYYTYDDLPKNLDIRLKRCLFPVFLYRHVRRNRKWDIIDATAGDTWFLGKMIGKNKLPKIVVTSHGLEHMFEEQRNIDEKNVSLRYRIWVFLNLKFVASSLKSADHICVLTHAEKEYISRKFSIPTERVSVIYHSLPEHFKGLPEYHQPVEFKILYVGNWLVRKGKKYILEALENLCSHNVNFSVTLAGLGIRESVVYQQMSKKLASRVKVIPFIENRDLPQLYLTHSLLLFPSLYEGFGMVLLEAMAAGLPIITTEAGIAKEWIKDKINGLVIPYRNSVAISEALIWAMNNPQEMNKYGENTRNLFEQMDMGEEAKKRMVLYSKLLNN